MAEQIEELRDEWKKEALDRVESLILRNAFACRTPDGTETTMAYTRYLRLTKMTNENYPLYLSLLEIDNHFVIDSLIGDEDPFVYFTPIQPTKHLLRECFRLLTFWHPGGIYPKTISIVLGVLQAAYNHAKDGNVIHRVSINDVNNLGKHLNKDSGQADPVNRAILDILDRLSLLEGQGDEEIEELARHCNNMRVHFFDRRRKMEDIIPQVLLVKSDYLVKEVAPNFIFED
ncbi:MAG: hypothetical protein GY866_05290 [Proteobacteria bacterium]|nr:hypothetical protein [Pseudomonadota bacterium]